ncbi:unnamed protein product [Didymodactylos carnosus]|uniref:Uncharacterized protein n=1 Tax=Didymodactylos carnosus TaxID=1234261 RepID=A0A815CTS0_9BILA|nr:unnamed protein product [Didymodactylos carnosus]CAF1369986.1 unnamed protein product [Didymodactylos carnosus]CAF4099648.1 unnamed protein product [Didymodactylos carnosus]CAF4179234.1 unnamed protein product [Didymodactylos carnosus]
MISSDSDNLSPTSNKINLKGSLLVIIGDLQALAWIHGFKCGFKHALMPWFLCNTTKEKLEHILTIDECDHRSMNEYLLQCDKLDNPQYNKNIWIYQKNLELIIDLFLRTSMVLTFLHKLQ